MHLIIAMASLPLTLTLQESLFAEAILWVWVVVITTV